GTFDVAVEHVSISLGAKVSSGVRPGVIQKCNEFERPLLRSTERPDAGVLRQWLDTCGFRQSVATGKLATSFSGIKNGWNCRHFLGRPATVPRRREAG